LSELVDEAGAVGVALGAGVLAGVAGELEALSPELAGAEPESLFESAVPDFFELL